MIGRILGRDVPACGFSIGFERIIAILQEHGRRARRARPAAGPDLRRGARRPGGGRGRRAAPARRGSSRLAGGRGASGCASSWTTSPPRVSAAICIFGESDVRPLGSARRGAVGRPDASLPHPHVRRASRRSTWGRPCGSPAGSIASAITAICSSSTSATHDGRHPVRARRDQPALRRWPTGLRLETVITVTGRWSPRGADAVNPKLATGRGRGRGRGSRRASRPPRPCPSRSTATRSIRRRRACATGSSISGGRGFIATSCCAARSSRRIRRRMIDGGLHRVPDADPDLQLPGGRPRLSGAEPRAPGQVLRAAAGAPAIQAAPDGGGLRPLLPDRAVLSRRGRARRPLAGRVLPARLRDVVRDPGGRVRGHRAGAARRLRGVPARLHGHAAALPAHPLRRGPGPIRHGQARPAQSPRHRRRHRTSSATPGSRCSRRPSPTARRRARACGRPGPAASRGASSTS